VREGLPAAREATSPRRAFPAEAVTGELSVGHPSVQ
jgi:hypothetical protein